MSISNRRFITPRKAVSGLLVLMLVLADTLAFAQRRGGGGGGRSRGSVSGYNRGGGSSSRSTYGSSSGRSSSYQGRGNATRDVSKDGDQVTVDKNLQTRSGASKDTQKTYDMGSDGRVESVERNTSVTGRNGQTANWEGKAERENGGWEFEGEGTNRYGQKVEADGYGARGPYGKGVVADVEGGRYGDRTVVAGRGYGGPVYARQLPAGYRPYNYRGNAYYGYGGAYYRPYHYGGVPYYGYMYPPWGAYYSTVPVGAIALTIAGAALLYSDGTYYSTTYVDGATQYEVVSPPAGATLPAGTSLPADRSAVTISGQTFYIAGNAFYRKVVTNGQESFVVVVRPAGLVEVKALPEDFVPMQAGSVMYFKSKNRYYLPFLDPSGTETYIVVDEPVGAVAAVPGAPGESAAAAPAAAPAVGPPAPAGRKTVTEMTAGPNTPLTVRVSTEIDSGKVQAGHRFQGNLSADLIADGRVIATRGTKVYGRVVEAKAGTGTGGKPLLVIELTDIEIDARVVVISTEPVSFSAEAKKAGKKVLGGAALGAGIGGMIDGGEGAAWGAGIGAVAGVAAAKSGPGNQVAVASGTAVEFRLKQPLKVSIVG